MAKARSKNRVGDFFLKPPGKKYWDYRICWYDEASKQVVHVRTGTVVESEAERKLSEHQLTAPPPRKRNRKGGAKKVLPKDEPLFQCLNRYYLKHLQHKQSAEKFRTYGLPMALMFFPEDAMVSDLTDAKQLEIIQALRTGEGRMADGTIRKIQRQLADGAIQKRARGRGHKVADGAPRRLAEGKLSDATIRKILAMWIAAVGYAVTFEHLDPQHAPKRVAAKKWKPRYGKGKKAVKIDQLAKLFNTAAKREHWWRYLICAVGTIGRSTAVRGLTGAQCDLDHKIITLLPEGDEQYENKEKATVPMCPTMEKWVRKWDTKETFATWGGKPLATNMFFKTLSLAAGVKCTAKNLRSTMISWLAWKGVPKWERSRAAGHSAPDGNTQDDYAVYDPEYLRNVSNAVEDLFETLAPLVNRDLLLREIAQEQPLPDEVWQVGHAPLSVAWGLQLLGAQGAAPPPAHGVRRQCSDGRLTELGKNLAAPSGDSLHINELASEIASYGFPRKDRSDDGNQ